MIKVMCVDDQVLLRETLIFMLARDGEIEALDGGSDGYEAIEQCEKNRPDVILMDVGMPGMDGIEATKRIKAIYPSIKIMILTTFENEESIMKAIENNIDGYMVKDTKPEELILAVKSVYHNLFVMHKSVLQIVKDDVTQTRNREKEVTNVVMDLDLSAMEIKIIKLMVDGKSNKEIAQILNFTEGTIKNKVSKLLSKMNMKDRTQIAVFAMKNNLI